MRILSLPVDFVKTSIGSKRSLLLAIAVVSVMAMLLTIPTLIYPSLFSRSIASSRLAEASRPRSVQRSNDPHVLAAYYSLNDNLSSALMLSNQGPLQMEVKPTLFSLAGERFDVPAAVLDKKSARSFDLQEWVSLAGKRFREGSIQIFYRGGALEVAGVLIMTDVSRSLIFDQELTEPSREFRSSQLEGVWWLPSNKSEAKLAVSNTTDQPISVTIDIGQSKVDRELQSLSLNPNETRVVVLDDSSNPSGNGNDLNDVQRNKSKLPRYGGISINHTGAPGAIIACGFVQDVSAGYSSIIEFSDPQKAKSNRLDGAGLRIGEIAGEKLEQIALVRNVGDSVNKVNVRIPYALENGNKGEVRLPEINLEPGETRMLNLDKFIEREIHHESAATAGLEIEYTGAPGSIAAMANSYTQNLNQVFRLILKDAKSQASSTGEYPWSLEDNSSSIIYIKNVSDKPQQFALYIFHAEGGYVSGLKTIDPSQTMEFNIRELRDNQVPDINGNTIPLNIAGGTAHWSITGSGGPDKLLTGRIEQSSPLKGLSMTAACESCCPDSYEGSYAEPSEFTININETKEVTLYSIYSDCHGVLFPPVIDRQYAADVSDPSVAELGSKVRGLSPGFCVFSLYFNGIIYSDNGDGSCRGELPPGPTADVVVEVQCNVPTGETQASMGWITVGQHLWRQTLQPTTTDWAGRRFREVSYAPSTDGCHFQNSIFPHVPLFLPTEQFTLETNQYDDLVGYTSAEAVNYYRVERPLRGLPLPCEYNNFQEVEMFCGDVPMPFVRVVLRGQIGATTISSFRGDQGAGRTWP